MDCNSLSIKDWIYLAGLAITLGLFLWRLRVDGRFAAYRETISYLEKRSPHLKVLWKKNNSNNPNNDDVNEFLGELDQIALLVNKKGFDAELVYNYWWKYFYFPLIRPEIKSIFDAERRTDKSIYENYKNLCDKWHKRILKEQGYS